MLLDEEEKEVRLQERAALARAFKTMREEVVEKKREQDRLDRNAAKERQLQEAEEMQVHHGNFIFAIINRQSGLTQTSKLVNLSVQNFTVLTGYPFQLCYSYFVKPHAIFKSAFKGMIDGLQPPPPPHKILDPLLDVIAGVIPRWLQLLRCVERPS